MKPVLVSYVPVPHRGYIEFFRRHAGAELYVLGKELGADFVSVVRNLPANNPEDIVLMIKSLGIFSDVHVLTPAMLTHVKESLLLIMPDEDVSRELAEKHFSGMSVRFESVWLRWHKDAVLQGKVPENDGTVSYADLDRQFLKKASGLSDRSSDWWRQVGALAVKDGEILFGAYNKHQPSEHSPYLFGDPRSHFNPGQFIEMSSALHAELGVITAAACRGVKLEGSSLYVTTFPCPPCANAIANAGFSKVFYAEGYSLIAGDNILRSKGIELIRVVAEKPSL